MARTTTDWDAEAYHRLSAPQEEWAGRVLERLPLEGDETVLDAGCGSGRVTALLLDRLPEGRVIGVDGSPSMIATAREQLSDRGERVRLINLDLLELSPEVLRGATGAPAVDAVFSNATFHWIADQKRLFEALFSVLRAGGRFVTQSGGCGNVAGWRQAVERASARVPFAAHLEGFSPWHFRGPEEVERSLVAAGFEQVRCWLEELPAIRPDDPGGFVSVVGLAVHRERLPEELHDPFTEAVIEELPRPLEFHYVRLNADARRPR